MDFEKLTSKLNNRQIVAFLDEKSDSFKKFGPKFIGRLVGRTSKSVTGGITKVIVSVTILTSEYLTHQIPTEDIRTISEIFTKNL